MLMQRPIVYLGLLATLVGHVVAGVSGTATKRGRKPATTPTERTTNIRRRRGEL